MNCDRYGPGLRAVLFGVVFVSAFAKIFLLLVVEATYLSGWSLTAVIDFLVGKSEPPGDVGGLDYLLR